MRSAVVGIGSNSVRALVVETIPLLGGLLAQVTRAIEARM